VTTGQTTKSIPKDEIVAVRVVDDVTAVKLPPAARFREYTVPEGTVLRLKLSTPINSATNRAEDPVEAPWPRRCRSEAPRSCLPAVR
jgi:hypothetical protein